MDEKFTRLMASNKCLDSYHLGKIQDICHLLFPSNLTRGGNIQHLHLHIALLLPRITAIRLKFLDTRIISVAVSRDGTTNVQLYLTYTHHIQPQSFQTGLDLMTAHPTGRDGGATVGDRSESSRLNS